MEPFTPDPPVTPPTPVPPPVPALKRIRLIVGLLFLLILMGALLALTSNKVRFEQVISESMETTLLKGDTIMTDANATPHRYDIVCFKDPDKTSDDILVKRIIGLPGDTIVIQDGILYLNGKDEYSTAIPENKIIGENMRKLVPDGTYFVMGDNRNNSEDSRVFGPIAFDSLTGVVMCIVWPPSRWGTPQKLH